jgi:hypothetical protein
MCHNQEVNIPLAAAKYQSRLARNKMVRLAWHKVPANVQNLNALRKRLYT